MLRELAPNASAPTVELIEQPTAEQAAAFYAAAHKNGFSFALDAEEPTEAEPEADEPELHQTMSLLDGVEEAETKAESSIGVSAEPGKGLCLPLTPELKALFEDPFVPKRIHDLKLALHVLCGVGVELRGKLDDSQLLSYVLNPTHTTQTPAEVAARHNQPRRTRLQPPQLSRKSSLRISERKLSAAASPLFTRPSTCLSRVFFFAWRKAEFASTKECSATSPPALAPKSSESASGFLNWLESASILAHPKSSVRSCSAGWTYPCPSSTGRARPSPPPKTFWSRSQRNSRSFGSYSNTGICPSLNRRTSTSFQPGGCRLPRAHHIPIGRHIHRQAVVVQPQSPKHPHRDGTRP